MHIILGNRAASKSTKNTSPGLPLVNLIEILEQFRTILAVFLEQNRKRGPNLGSNFRTKV